MRRRKSEPTCILLPINNTPWIKSFINTNLYTVELVDSNHFFAAKTGKKEPMEITIEVSRTIGKIVFSNAPLFNLACKLQVSSRHQCLIMFECRLCPEDRSACHTSTFALVDQYLKNKINRN